MRLVRKHYRRIKILTVFCLAIGLLSGCTGIGPRFISKGRADYNAAINQTEDEQMLLSIVKGRYGESSTLLAVSGIAASVRFSTNASINAGFGPEANYLGNLVPFSGGLVYEENPTITYSPVNSEQYMRQMMSPIPLDILLLSIRTMDHSNHIFFLLINRVNNLRNPDFIYSQSAVVGRRYIDFVDLFMELRQAGVIDLAIDPKKKNSFAVVISDQAGQYSDKVKELLSLLDIQPPEAGSGQMVIPVSYAHLTKEGGGIGITTRSTMDLVEILRAAVKVPEEHELAELALIYPQLSFAVQGIKFDSSLEQPDPVSVAVNYRGYWFYIDDTDQYTKEVFGLLRAFWSIGISGSIDDDSAPVLTLPVRN